jgi:hypothetical protein
MPIVTVGTDPICVLEADPKRKFVSFQNTSSQSTTSVYLDTKPGPVKDVIHKWRLRPDNIFIITRQIGYPERAFYAVASAEARLVIGFQNDDEETR